MKFGKQLERHKVRGWDAFYVDYTGLKTSLRRHCGKPCQPGDSDEEAGSITEKSAPPCEALPDLEGRTPFEAWFDEVEESIDRVNDFFHSMADEVEGHLDAAVAEFDELKGSGMEAQWKDHLQLLLTQLQGTLLDLSHFAAANYTALYKIFKKHDKLTGLCVLPSVLPHIAEEPFHNPGKERLQSLQQQLRTLADDLGLGEDLQLVSSQDRSTMEIAWPLARLSFSLGVIVMALVVLAVLSGMDPSNDGYSVEALAATIPIFRVVFMMNLAVWLAGCCAAVFERYKINYLFLLDISPELDVTAMSLLNFAAVLTGLWIVLFFGFLADVKFGAVLLTSHSVLGNQWLVAYVYTVALLSVSLGVTFSWVDSAHRLYIGRLLWRLCFQPHLPVTFAENIFADFLTSVSKLLKDLVYTGCYLRHWREFQASKSLGAEVQSMCGQTSGLEWVGLQFLLVLPLLIRVSQCFRRVRDTGVVRPHLLNSIKYSTAVCVSILAAVSPETMGLTNKQAQRVRLAAYFVATVYAATWDLVMDFGLAHRQRRCLFPRAAYGVLAFVNVVLRSTWLLTFVPDCRALVTASAFNSECFIFMISALELVRRAIWATIRLEHEHLSNASRFRAVCWVPPLEHRQDLSKTPRQQWRSQWAMELGLASLAVGASLEVPTTVLRSASKTSLCSMLTRQRSKVSLVALNNAALSMSVLSSPRQDYGGSGPSTPPTMRGAHSQQGLMRRGQSLQDFGSRVKAGSFTGSEADQGDGPYSGPGSDTAEHEGGYGLRMHHQGSTGGSLDTAGTSPGSSHLSSLRPERSGVNSWSTSSVVVQRPRREQMKALARGRTFGSEEPQARSLKSTLARLKDYKGLLHEDKELFPKLPEQAENEAAEAGSSAEELIGPIPQRKNACDVKHRRQSS